MTSKFNKDEMQKRVRKMYGITDEKLVEKEKRYTEARKKLSEIFGKQLSYEVDKHVAVNAATTFVEKRQNEYREKLKQIDALLDIYNSGFGCSKIENEFYELTSTL